MQTKFKQIRMRFVFELLVIAVIFCSCSKQQQAEQQTDERPNIIFILADDLGYGDLGCYGQTTLSTPNIDQLAAEGIRLTNHYTGSSVCAPSRASLLTGLHTGHVSVRANQSGQLLKDEEVTIAEKLKEAGYTTGIIGKWGVGHPPPPDDPARHGFDHAYGYINMWHAHNFYPEFLYKNGEKVMLPENKLARDENGNRKWAADQPEGAGVAEVKGQHTHELFEQDALRFIEDNQDEKFFLYLALNMPHANNEHPTNGMEVPGVDAPGVDSPSYGEFADKDWPEPEKGFARMIQMIDQSVGKIEQKLQSLGLDQNTLVIFASDNGPHQEGFHTMEFFNSNGELRGMKRDFYDGGIKTPFIAKWPGKVKAGTTSGHLSAFWDLLPTFCAVAEVAPPEQIDGISFLPTLLGQKGQQQHDYLYWEFYEQGGKQTVIKDQYKAVKLNVRTGSPDPIELYNLEEGPGEQNNIADEHPDMVETMQQRMDMSHTPLGSVSLFKQEI